MNSKPASERQPFRLPGRSNRLFWAVLGGLLSLAAILLLLAPLERTLGEGIRSVYLHVALTWAGMLGILFAAIPGLWSAANGKRPTIDWARTISWVALTMFALGLLMSLLAASINWGSVFWQEPRTQSALEILALGLIAQIASYWPVPVRLKGSLYILLASFMIWNVSNTPLILHPGNAARTSSSAAIRWSFIGLFALVSGAAAWVVINRRLAGDRKMHESQNLSSENNRRG